MSSHSQPKTDLVNIHAAATLLLIAEEKDLLEHRDKISDALIKLTEVIIAIREKEND